MGRLKDLTGGKFGRLTVLGRSGTSREKKAVWECLCECGSKVYLIGYLLTSGHTKSCGCYRSDATTSYFTKHGHSKPGNHSPEFNAWMNIKARCYDSKNSHYKYYGAIGVVMCDKWLNSFDDFLKDVGLRPSNKHSIDRWPNKTGNYEPGNVRWATQKQQQRNKRNNRLIEHKGEILVLQEWAERLKVNPIQIAQYLNKGKSMEEIINYYTHPEYDKNKTDRHKFSRLSQPRSKTNI